MDDYSLFHQFRGPSDFRDLSIPEFFEAIEKTKGIGLCPLIEEINVTSETGIAMKNDRLAANYQVMDLIFLEQPDELQDVSGEGSRIYLAA